MNAREQVAPVLRALGIALLLYLTVALAIWAFHRSVGCIPSVTCAAG